MSGLFITFEGGEGTGKSTQCQKLGERLRSYGREVVLTREPGGWGGAEDIRALLVSGATDRWSVEAEALLNYAARDDHLRHRIRPALSRDGIVICDRFMDSTRAYQGYAGGCDMAMIDLLEKNIVGNTRPRISFVFDLDPEIGLKRARARGSSIEDRYERKSLDFHRRIRDGFGEIARLDPARCKVIDASRTGDEVTEMILGHLAPWL